MVQKRQKEENTAMHYGPKNPKKRKTPSCTVVQKHQIEENAAVHYGPHMPTRRKCLSDMVQKRSELYALWTMNPYERFTATQKKAWESGKRFFLFAPDLDSDQVTRTQQALQSKCVSKQYKQTS